MGDCVWGFPHAILWFWIHIVFWSLSRLLHTNLSGQLPTIYNIMDWRDHLVPRSQCHVDLRSAVRPRMVLSIDDCGVVAPINILVRFILRKAWSVLLVQGVLAGFGMGLTYAPSIAVVSQHFSTRRTMVMSLVTSGTPLGSMIHPIMLNHLLNGTVGFARGVRASAGFVSALLLIACLSMRTRGLVAPTVSYTTVVRKCSREVLFILMTIGSTLFQIGFYYPLFYMQLDSVKHGININFSFYSLVILNAACFIGRCTAGIAATYMGVLNLAHPLSHAVPSLFPS